MTMRRLAILVFGVLLAAVAGATAEAASITVDATVLSAPFFVVDGSGAITNGSPTVLDLTVGPHTFDPGPLGFAFDVTVLGTVDFDSSLDAYVSGRGTSTLTVTGFAIAVDATAMTAPSFNIERGNVAPLTSTATVATVHLLPGAYGEFNCGAGSESTSFPFTVTTAGLLDLNPSLDAYVSGRGTSTLTVTGFPITVDATAMTAPTFNINRGNASPLLPTAVVTTLHLLPGLYGEFNCG
ncbi:MAG TPA: hypothetical protein VMS22_08965, partial [Candidatus Eisenbacteria bacterium]|nr:hypothetical protein [Candidatus Eisenbacteria bacterium]